MAFDHYPDHCCRPWHRHAASTGVRCGELRPRPDATPAQSAQRAFINMGSACTRLPVS